MFFKNTEDAKKYVSINASFSFKEFEVFLKDVDRSVFKTYLGQTFLSSLQTKYNDSVKPTNPVALSSKEAELIEHLRWASANFAIGKWIPSGQLSIDNAGIRIANSDTHKTAFEWQIQDLMRSVNEVGYNSLEDALEYLDNNIDDFATYKSSDAFKENNYLFVSSAAEFSKHYSAFNSSRINFIKIRSIIRKTEEFEIKSIILPNLFADLKTKLQDGTVLGSYNKSLIELIQPALVHLSMARAIQELSASITPEGFLVFDNTGGKGTTNSKKIGEENTLNRMAIAAERDGHTFLKALKTYIDANVDNYPLYANDSLYVAPEDEVDLNAGTNNFFSGL
jgi:hypothetical protein